MAEEETQERYLVAGFERTIWDEVNGRLCVGGAWHGFVASTSVPGLTLDEAKSEAIRLRNQIEPTVRMYGDRTLFREYRIYPVGREKEILMDRGDESRFLPEGAVDEGMTKGMPTANVTSQ
ncbi:MAG: hypothetical protein ABIH92_05280 [Nanoarchaeota archaeon]